MTEKAKVRNQTNLEQHKYSDFDLRFYRKLDYS